MESIKVTKDDRKLAKDKKKAEKKEKFLSKTKTFSNTNFEKKVNVKASNAAVVDIKTPAGCKKDTERELPNSYCPIYTEEGWFNWWEHKGYFKPEYNEKKSSEKFVIMIPPPNVTGILHIGHALTCSIEDCIVRWNRMQGKQTLWLPGTDHAGIATQTVVEKKLLRERNQTRHDLGREEFIKEVWKWKEEKGDCILNQLRQLGSSCDFSRLRFTMEESMSKAVTETFVRLFEEKLIYRSKRLVNWSCSLRSAISDIEVDKVEITKRTFINVPNYEKPIEFGCLVHFAYEIMDTKEKVFVATTRIETMLGDTAIAIHPDDNRYRHLHGKFATHPFVPSRILPIICDEFVDKDFGTGAVKITPAHDHNDYEVGKRHNLEFINILSDNGHILEGFGEFSGMKRFDARLAIIGRMKELGLFEKITDNPMVIPVCSKSKDIIEPIIKNQWYLRCKEMAKEALRVVEEGELKLLPEGVHNVIWTRWLEDCHDWCISRQLWWGHQIPVYKVTVIGDGDNKQEFIDENDNWVAGRSKEEAKKLASEKFNQPIEKIDIEQDPDVLDTWFSSQLFPFATMGWPNETSEDLRKFYPGNLLETGHDIIFFWVARMVMIGLKMMGKLPFDSVYLHAMIRDAHGKKMSKSLGNVINPYDVIKGISLEQLQKSLESGNLDPKELTRARASQMKDFPSGIPQCGTDALRFALLAYTSQSRDINLDVMRINGYRNFCNKIWQAFRFCQMFGLTEKSITIKSISEISGNLSPTDKWILSKLSFAVREINEALKSYNFSLATTIIHRFWLYELCDVYIEYGKRFRFDSPRKNDTIVHVLYECLEVGLRLLHPMMPFITEELHQRLPRRRFPSEEEQEESIMVSPYPKSDDYQHLRNIEIESKVELANEITKKIRSYRKEISMLDKQVLIVSVKMTDEVFCGDYLHDLILPLSNSKLNEDDDNKNSWINQDTSIFLGEQLEIFVGVAGEEKDKYGEIFTCKTTEEQKSSFLKQLKLFHNNKEKLDEVETATVRQWCNWLNNQTVKGKSAIKDTLEFVNQHLLTSTYLSCHRYPTLADSLMLNYLSQNVHKNLLEKYSNIVRWEATVNNT